MPQRHRVLPMVVLAMLVAACGSAAPNPATSPSTTAAASVVATAVASPAPSRQPSSVPTELGPHLRLVGLGDSVPGGLKCIDPCRSYVVTYGDLAAAALGEGVMTTNLATNDGLESGQLLDRVRKRDEYRTAIAGADIVTLQVGWNDWQGPCGFANRTTCLLFGIGRVKPNVEGILAEIASIRGRKPTVIRVLTYYNGFLGNPQAPSIWGFAAEPGLIATFDKDFRAALADFNAMLCELAAAHDALCVKVGTAFNGKHLDQPAAAGLINSDGIHGLRAGHDLIAKVLDETGYAPLR